MFDFCVGFAVTVPEGQVGESCEGEKPVDKRYSEQAGEDEVGDDQGQVEKRQVYGSRHPGTE